MENLKFIFDVDGTITPSRKKITEDFLPFFNEFVEKNDVYLVTGSDRDKNGQKSKKYQKFMFFALSR